MKVLIAITALVAAASAGVIPATTLVRTPSLDSAVIQSDRLGGNFAYSSVEGHAYAAVSPVVQNVISPVGISYAATPIATPINLVHQQVVPAPFIGASPQFITSPQLIAPPQFIGAPTLINPVVPGVIPIAPEPAQEGEKPQGAEPTAPIESAEPAEVAPAVPETPAASEPAPEAPQSDDVVAVESA